jgi:hypothetical protein
MESDPSVASLPQDDTLLGSSRQQTNKKIQKFIVRTEARMLTESIRSIRDIREIRVSQCSKRPGANCDNGQWEPTEY